MAEIRTRHAYRQMVRQAKKESVTAGITAVVPIDVVPTGKLRVPKRTLAEKLAAGVDVDRMVKAIDQGHRDRRPMRQSAEDRRPSSLLRSFA